MTDTGYVWRNARLLVVDASVSEAVIKALVPPEVTLAQPPKCSFFVADYPEPGHYGAPYREAAVLVHAIDTQGGYCYCPWMIVTTDTALILGRDLYGFPKKLGTITLTEAAGKVIGTVARNDTEVLRIEATLGPLESAASAPNPFGARTLNAFGTNIEGMKLLETPAQPATMHSSHTVKAKLILVSSKTDELAKLEATPQCSGRYYTLDFGSYTPPPKLIGTINPAWGPQHFVERSY